MVDAAKIERAGRLLREARRTLFITGAGISADSGVPTYRGIGGLYNVETTEDGIPIEEALSGEMLRREPALCWKYVAQIEAACRGVQPNRAHDVIAALEQRQQICVLTQNVDGLHQAAGCRNVIAIHGDVHRLVCMSCGRTEEVVDYAHLELPPRCRDCAGLIRPDVVLFGEILPQAAIEHLQRELATGFDLVCSVGTSAVFPYIVGPIIEAARSGVPTIEINPSVTEVSTYVDVHLQERAASAFEALWQEVDR
ncbi:MAG: NAD-dependent deacylase [Planctomycetota bacterium]